MFILYNFFLQISGSIYKFEPYCEAIKYGAPASWEFSHVCVRWWNSRAGWRQTCRGLKAPYILLKASRRKLSQRSTQRRGARCKMKYLPAASACTRQPNWIKSQRHKTLGWLRAHAQGGSHSLTHSHAPRKSGSAREREKTSLTRLLSRPSNFSCSLYTPGRRRTEAACACYWTRVWLSLFQNQTLSQLVVGLSFGGAAPVRPPAHMRIRPSSPLLTCLESEMASFQPLILLSCSLILSPNVFHPPNGPPARRHHRNPLPKTFFFSMHAPEKRVSHGWRQR